MNKKSPFIVAISGVGGAGKNSVMEVFKKYPTKFTFFVSYTDRPQRDDDIPDESYHFISEEEFSKAIKDGEFLEWEQVRGKYRYGRKKADFHEILNSGKIPVMNIEVLGVEKFKKFYNILSFFILPPSREEAIKRMQKRGTDTPEAIQHRIDRYDLELSHKKKFDHVVINEDLKKAQQEVLDLIKKEIKRDHKKKLLQNISLFSAVLLIIAGVFFYLFKYDNNQFSKLTGRKADVPTVSNTTNVDTGSVVNQQATVQASTSADAKKKISAAPPKNTVTKKNIVERTKKNSDGTSTTTVSTSGTASSADLANVASITANISSPYDIIYRDETGAHADLEKKLKDYINNQLKWRNEISSMKEITLRDAGDTGWNGQYLGQYSVSANGQDIISSTGAVILNTYYYKNSSLFDEYMKLILSHEYGHHYTLSHKWVDWDLPAGTRFPDSYYAVRPLSKSTTATDYSLGWKNCEVEIIAEDYSYLYSGYGLDAMSSTYGYPSVATKTWLDNIGSASEIGTVTNNPPTLEIVSPTSSSVVSGQVSFTVNTSDDLSTPKVSFYVGDNLLSEDSASPYEAIINSKSFANGTYVLKAVATDGTNSVEKTISVTFQNETVDLEKPTISIDLPNSNPYTLTSDELNIKVSATDNMAIDKIELYFEDTYQNSWNLSNLNLKTSFTGIIAGTYTLKFRAYDTAGNFAEATLTVIKP